MASLIYDSYFDDVCKGNILPASDTIKVLLTTSAYTPAKTHAKRSDVTNEITGTGYTALGNTVTCSLTLDTANHREDLALGGTTWPSSTLTARVAVYFKSRGGASSADNLIAAIDFGADVSTTSGTLTLTGSTLRIQN